MLLFPVQNALAAKWGSYIDPLTGKKLNVRPHWAKEFPNQVGEDDFTAWPQKAFEKQIPEFISAMKHIIKLNKGSFRKSMKMFSTKYLDMLFKEYY